MRFYKSTLKNEVDFDISEIPKGKVDRSIRPVFVQDVLISSVSSSDTLYIKLYIFLTHSSSGNFAETRDSRADRHRVSPNHAKFHQNSPRAVDELGNELSHV